VFQNYYGVLKGWNKKRTIVVKKPVKLDKYGMEISKNVDPSDKKAQINILARM